MNAGGWICLVLWLGMALSYCTAAYDETDAPPIRSQTALRTDHGTGCQYLAGAFGFALTPRMDARGKHIGCRP